MNTPPPGRQRASVVLPPAPTAPPEPIAKTAAANGARFVIDVDGREIAVVSRGPDVVELYFFVPRVGATLFAVPRRGVLRVVWWLVWRWWVRETWCGVRAWWEARRARRLSGA